MKSDSPANSVAFFQTKLREVGQRIREARQYQGMTQEELAQIIDVSPKTISSLEVARVGLSIAHLQAIAIALDKPIGYFAGEDATTLELQLDTLADELSRIQKVINNLRSKSAKSK